MHIHKTSMKKKKRKNSFWGPPCYFRSKEGEINRPLSHSLISPLATRSSAISIIKKTIVWNFFSCFSSCRKHTSTERMHIHKSSIKDGAYYCYCAYVLRISRYSQGKGKGTRYLTSEVPLLSREYPPRKPTVRSFYPPLSISALF